MPKLSIITVNLNNKAGLAATAESVIAQTWTDYEWIIIDGGSADGGAELVRAYAEKTPKLVYHCSEKDGGVYFGMNKGIEKASGEYCCFLNSGDCLRGKTTLGEIFAHEFDEDIVYGDMARERRGGRLAVRKYGDKLRPSDLMYGFLQHQNMLLKRELLDRKNGYDTDYGISADWVFYTKAICVDKASYRHIPAVFALLQRGGISDKPEYRDIFKAERARAVRGMFSAGRRLLYAFTIASLRNKAGRVWYRICLLLRGREQL
jgi:glycosyltransferase involved in cell wall biosynthesis